MVNPSRMFLVLFLLILFSAGYVYGQESGDGGFGDGDAVDDLLARVEMAIEDESYTRAINLLEEGRTLYPDDYRLPRMAGDLYLDRGLYRLSLAEYRSAAALSPYDDSIQWDIAVVLGFLDRNQEVVDILEDLLAGLGPDDGEEGRTLRDRTIDDLSWMYFKTHRFEEGVTLLEAELEREFDLYWAHTLGTLYSGLYDLEHAREWYARATDEALVEGDTLFASIACYNRALLEFSFYNYEKSREMAMRSLELRDRAGGHLVVGELDFMAWDLSAAREAYRQAESLDGTPLTAMDLAEFHQRLGYLDEALRYLDTAEGDGDTGWMYRYGLDGIRFGMDTSRVRSDALTGKAEVEALTPRAGLGNRLRSLWERIRWRREGQYQDRRFRSLSDTFTRGLREEGSELDAAWNGAKAQQGYRRPATALYEEARELEMVFAPRSGPWYDLEIGIETRDRLMILRALESFSPLEGDPMERSLREIVLNGSGKASDAAGRSALERLYGLNPGGLRQYGLSLPVAVISSGDRPGTVRRRVVSLLRRSGYRIADSRDTGPGVATLRIMVDDGRIRWFMEDPKGTARSSAESGMEIRRTDLAPVLAGLLDVFYSTPLRDDTE